MCKTYKKDPIFTNSLENLCSRAEDEVQCVHKRMLEIADKKTHYKKLARGFKGEFEQALDQERVNFEKCQMELQQVIQGQTKENQALTDKMKKAEESFQE